MVVEWLPIFMTCDGIHVKKIIFCEVKELKNITKSNQTGNKWKKTRAYIDLLNGFLLVNQNDWVSEFDRPIFILKRLSSLYFPQQD